MENINWKFIRDDHLVCSIYHQRIWKDMVILFPPFLLCIYFQNFYQIIVDEYIYINKYVSKNYNSKITIIL